MKIKKLITLIEMLSLTGLISVGFSSWLIVETELASLEGTIKAENVIDNNKYLEIKTMSFSDYDTSGFFIDFVYDSNRSMTGYLDVVIDVDLQEFKTGVTSSNKYKFNLNLVTESDFSIKGTSYLFYDLMKDEAVTYYYTISTASSSSTFPSTVDPYVPSTIYVPNTTYTVNSSSFTQSPTSFFSSFIIENGSSADLSLRLNLKYGFTVDVDKLLEITGNTEENKATAINTFFSTFSMFGGVDFQMIASMEGV